MLELGEHLLDRVGIAKREKPQFGAFVFDHLAHGVAFMAIRVVHDDDVSGLKRWSQSLLDLRQECFAVDRAGDDARRNYPVLTQASDQGRGVPMPEGGLAGQPLPFGAQPRTGATLVLIQVSKMSKSSRSRSPSTRLRCRTGTGAPAMILGGWRRAEHQENLVGRRIPGQKPTAALKKLGLGPYLETVNKSKDINWFTVIYRRWVVERTSAWMSRCRRLAKNYGRSLDSSSAWRSWPRAASCCAESEGMQHAVNKQ